MFLTGHFFFCTPYLYTLVTKHQPKSYMFQCVFTL